MGAKSVPLDLERAEKEKLEIALKAATAAKLNEHRRSEKSERVEYQVLGIGPDPGPLWHTDEEVSEVLRKDTRASGAVYGTHYAIRFACKQMVPTPVIETDARAYSAQAEQLEHNPFASPIRGTSTSPLPTQGQAGCSCEGDSPRAAGSLLQDTRSARKVVLEEQLSSSTDRVEAPAKEQAVATHSGVEVGQDDRQSVPTRQHSV